MTHNQEPEAPATEQPAPFVPGVTPPQTAKEFICLQSQVPELAAWAATHQGTSPYGYDEEPPFTDFNREMFAPGQNPSYPEGVVGIRCDDDFWICAALPWRFKEYGLQKLLSTLWPNMMARHKVTFSYDRGPAAELGLQDTLKELGDYAQQLHGMLKMLERKVESLRHAAAAGGDPFHYFDYPAHTEEERWQAMFPKAETVEPEATPDAAA